MIDESKIKDCIMDLLRHVDVINEKVHNIELTLRETHKKLDETNYKLAYRLDVQDKTMAEMMGKLDDRFAPKIVATMLTVLASTILLAFLGGLIALVWPHEVKAAFSLIGNIY